MQTILIIFNLFILESLLSVDNAAVLAIMVKDLPDKDKPKALRYGLLGAYIMRGTCLFLAAWLIKIIWLKVLGGLYLLYLVYGFFFKKEESEDNKEEKESKVFIFAKKIGLNKLWATIVLVEVMDLAFSIDNVFAAVALSNNFYVIMAGVAIGILAMRFVATWFVSLINKFPSLETSAFIVIGLLALKLILSGLTEYVECLSVLKLILENKIFDLIFSALMMVIFFTPIIIKKWQRNQSPQQ